MEERVARAVAACYEAVLAPEQWADALHALSRSIDAACTMFYPHKADQLALEAAPISHEYKDFIDFYIKHRWYEGHYRADRGWPLLAQGRTIIEHDITTDEERRTLRHYNELYLPFGFHGFAAVSFRVEGRLWAASILRAGIQGDFTPRDRTQLEMLGSHFARMVSFAERFATAQAAAGIAMLDRLDRAALLLDAHGYVVQLNTRAEALLGEDLRLTRGKLTAAHRQSNTELQGLIRAAVAPDSSPATVGAEPAIVRRLGRRPLLVETLPIAGIFADVFSSTRAMLVITDLEARTPPSSARLRRVFSLTPAEVRLATRLTTGDNLDRIADELGISKETARAQLRSVLGKTDTHRQAELVSLLARLTR